MKTSWWIILAAFATAFGAVYVLKTNGGTETQTTPNPRTTASEHRFWEVYRTATNHRTARRTSEAAAAYEELLTLNPEHEDGLYYLGNMYVELGRYGPADSVWQRLAALNPTSSRAHSRIGDLRLCFADSDLLDFSAAAEAYGRARSVNSEETGPLLRAGLAQLAIGRHAAAKAYFDDVTASNVQSVQGHFFGGYVEWRAGDPAGAESRFAAAVRAARPPGRKDVIGEGDTRGATNELRAASTDCPAFDRYEADLAAGHAAPEDMDPIFRSVHRNLADLRKAERRGRATSN